MADVVLVTGDATGKGVPLEKLVTVKQAANKPVLSLNYGGEIDALIREHALGWSVDARDEREILDALRESHTLWKTEPGYQSEPVDFEQYDYRQIVDRYRLVLESLL